VQQQTNFIVYKSSAGSGKTFTLVKEYLKLALSDNQKLARNFKTILALTFTNKAAAEMRSRIISALKDLSLPVANENLRNILLADLHISNTELQNRASELLVHILHHYSDFAVSTIDSFSHRIVKTFAQDLNLPVNFNLQTDTEEFYSRVIAGLFDEIGHDEELTRLLKEYTLNNINEKGSWDPQPAVEKFAINLQKENALHHLRNLEGLNAGDLEKFKQEIKDFLNKFRTAIQEPANKAMQLIKKHQLVDADFYQAGRGPQNLFFKCSKLRIDENPVNTYVLNAINEDKWESSNTSDEVKSIFGLIKPQLTQCAKQIVDLIESSWQKHKLYKLLDKSIYPLLLLKKIKEVTESFKQEEQLVFVEEFNTRIYEFIKNEPVSYIYERLGDRYKNFLLDEFQDTSTLQWLNLLPLIENSLAEGHLNLLVGDGKQSIYRWRNANVNQFMKLPLLDGEHDNSSHKEREQALVRNYNKQLLNQNFRSFKHIVDFNNRLFSFLANDLLREPYVSIYSEHEQTLRNQTPGYVSILSNKVPRDEYIDYHCNQTLVNITKAIQSGFRYRDVCVIASTNKYGSEVATFLTSVNIPVVSSDSLLLKNNTEVNVLISVLQFLQHPGNELSSASVLCYLSDNKKFSPSLHVLLEQLKSIGLINCLTTLGYNWNTSKINTLNLLDIVAYFISLFKLHEVETAAVYLRFFMDEVSKFMSQYGSDISEFITWWEKRSDKASLVISDQMDAVKIMTIHRSKGLEFPVVIVPFCDWKIQEREAWIELNEVDYPVKSAYLRMSSVTAQAGFAKEVEKEKQETILDNLNLIYVAFTRAVERLHVISAPKETAKGVLVSSWLEKFIKNSELFNVTENLHEFGNLQTALSPNTEDNEESVIISGLPILPFNKNIRIKSSFILEDTTSDAIENGIITHKILSDIETINDIDNAVYSAIQQGLITAHLTENYKKIILGIITHPLISKYYKEGINVKNEKELITAIGSVLRPDRVCLTDSECCIIDYKTGKEFAGKHRQQMMDYAEALQTLNYQKIKKFIVYTASSEVIEVY